jgi:serine protease Do
MYLQKIILIGLLIFSTYLNVSCKSETETSGIYTDANSISSKLDEVNDGLGKGRQNAITQAVAIACPAIVGINITEVRKVEYRHPFMDDPLLRWFMGENYGSRTRQYEIQGLGSGFIISHDGYILTNHHIAGNASKIVITMTDGTKHEAEIIGSDRISDVALLKINAKNLPYLNLSNSDDVLVGEWAIAFGNPFGLFDKNAKPTVTVGVVSNKDVDLIAENKVYKGMIQTDAAISSGNSGGPLVNALGEVIGMNTIIFSTATDQKGAGSIGIGFSIPINRVKKIVDMIKKDKTINRNFITGMEVRDIDERIARYLQNDVKEGVVIFSINRRSPAEEAGFEPGDIVLEIEGQKINKTDDYLMMVYDAIAGQKLDFVILRGEEKLKKKLYLKPM